MPVLSYRTIDHPSEGVYKEKGSKFLAFAYPVVSEADIRDHLAALQKKYYDARHHCYAWMLGPEKKLFRAFDDGEPNHSAGDPILGQIRSKDLTNVLVVVVRYFGGTKLGVGGLINAYKQAAADALDKIPVIEREITKSFTIHYDYTSTPEVMKLVKDFELEIVEQSFQDSCMLKAMYKLKDQNPLNEKLELFRALGHIKAMDSD
jgi:uncharacterized YigZ family protein